MVTSVARSRRSCDLGVHGNVVPYRAYILAVRAVVDATRWRHTSVHLSQHDRAIDRALDRQRQKGARRKAVDRTEFTERRRTTIA